MNNIPIRRPRYNMQPCNPFPAIIKTTMLLASLLFLPACLASDDPMYSVQDGVTPLEGGHGFHASFAEEPLFMVANVDGAYNVQRPKKQITQAIATPLPGHENFYTVQVQSEYGSYNYLLVKYTDGGWFDDDTFSIVTFSYEDILAKYVVDGVDEDGTVQNRRGLEVLFSVALQTSKYDKTAYDMYDLDDQGDVERYQQVIAGYFN